MLAGAYTCCASGEDVMPCLEVPARLLRKGFGGAAEGTGALPGGGATEGVERPDCEFESCGERRELMSIIETSSLRV